MKIKLKENLNKSTIKSVCDILRMDSGVSASNYIEQFSWILFLKIYEKIEEQLSEIYENQKVKYKYTIDKPFQWSSWAKKEWKDKSKLILFINNNLFPYLKKLSGNAQKNKIRDIFKDLSNRIDSGGTLMDAIDILDKIEIDHIQDTHLLSSAYEEIIMESETQGDWSDQIYTPRPVVNFIVKVINPEIGKTIFDPFSGSCGFLIESFKYLMTNNKIGKKEWDILQNKTFFGIEKKPIPYLLGTMNMIVHKILVPNLIRDNSLDKNVFNVSQADKHDIILLNPPFAGKEQSSVSNNYPIKTKATDGMAIQYTHRHLKNGGKAAIILPDGKILYKEGIYKKIREEWLEKCNVHSIVSLPPGAFTSTGAAIGTKIIFFDKSGPTKNVWFGEVNGEFTKTKKIEESNFNEIFSLIKDRKESGISWIMSIDELKNNNYDLSPRNPNKKDKEFFIDLKKADLELKKLSDSNKANIQKFTELSNKFLEYLTKQNIKFKEFKLINICHVHIGGTPKRSIKNYFIGGKNLWASVSELNGSPIYETKEYLTDLGVKNSNVKLLKKGTPIMSFKLSIGKTGICGKDMYTNEAIAGFVPKDNNIDSEYILMMVSTLAKASKEKKGSLGQGSLNKKKLENLMIPMPILNNGKHDIEKQKFLLQHFYQSKLNKSVILDDQNKSMELLNNFEIFLLKELTK